MLVNLSNHTCDTWDEKQRIAAINYGEVIDFPFPYVNPSASKEDVSELATTIVCAVTKVNPSAVLCQGESTLAFSVVTKLKEAGFKVLAACSERNVTQETQRDRTIKRIDFDFVCFREY